MYIHKDVGFGYDLWHWFNPTQKNKTTHCWNKHTQLALDQTSGISVFHPQNTVPIHFTTQSIFFNPADPGKTAPGKISGHA